ncbi:unnamed protein product [Calypogeia fissa]
MGEQQSSRSEQASRSKHVDSAGSVFNSEEELFVIFSCECKLTDFWFRDLSTGAFRVSRSASGPWWHLRWIGDGLYLRR